MQSSDEVNYGVRRKEDEQEFKIRSKDPAIEPDRVTHPIQGYFRIPAVWIGDMPPVDKVKALNKAIHHEKVFNAELKCGIKVCVQKDGLFLFDFRNWPRAPMVIFPGYRRPDKVPYAPPKEVGPIADQIQEYTVIRSQVLNVHQVCLTTAETAVRGRFAVMGFPITTWNTHTTLSFNHPPSYHDDSECIRSMAHNLLNNSYGIDRKNAGHRREVELDVIAYSFKLLDRILTTKFDLLPIIEAAYMAAIRQTEHRLGEALILAWGASEQLLSHEWNKLQLLKSKNVVQVPQGKLPSAATMIKQLFHEGRLEQKLYDSLELARKARNDWVHKMITPKAAESGAAINSILALVKLTSKIPLYLQLGFRGGPGANTPFWIWDRVEKGQNIL